MLRIMIKPCVSFVATFSYVALLGLVAGLHYMLYPWRESSEFLVW